MYCRRIWPTEAKPNGSTAFAANAVGRISEVSRCYAVAVLLNGYGVTGVFVLLGAVADYRRRRNSDYPESKTKGVVSVEVWRALIRSF